MANNYRTLPRGLGKSEIESSRADAELRRSLREGTPLPAGTYELSMDEYRALFPHHTKERLFMQHFAEAYGIQAAPEAFKLRAYQQEMLDELRRDGEYFKSEYEGVWCADAEQTPFVQTIGRGNRTGRHSGIKLPSLSRRSKSIFNVANAKAVQAMRSQMLEADLILWDEAHVFDSPLKQVARMTYNDFYAPRISKHVGEMHPDLMTADNWREITVKDIYRLAVQMHNYPYACGHVDDWLATKAWVTYMDDVQLWRWHDESAPFVDYGYVRGMLMAQHYGQMNYSYLRLTLLRYNDFTRGVEGATTWKR